MLCSVDPIYNSRQMQIPILMFHVAIFCKGLHYIFSDALVLHRKSQ